MKTLFVHGGVSGTAKDGPPQLEDAVAAGSRQAAALDMVEASVRVLEDDPALNAGFGAVLDASGNVSLDAGIADGRSGRFGAVAGVTVAHPVSLARTVLASTPHVLMIGPGAMALAPDQAPVAISPARTTQWEEARASGNLGADSYGSPEKVDTVGAVALDASGDLAAASSTGGVFGKLPGRVGDSPIFGAGFYASLTAAVVGTGVGELFLETLASARVGALIERGAAPQEACEEVVVSLGSRTTAPAGLLAIDRSGRWGCAYRGASLTVFGPEGRVEAVRID